MITSEIIINKLTIDMNNNIDINNTGINNKIGTNNKISSNNIDFYNKIDTEGYELEFNEKELHDTIDSVFKNVGNDKNVKIKGWWYYCKYIICCGYTNKFD